MASSFAGEAADVEVGFSSEPVTNGLAERCMTHNVMLMRYSD